MALNPQRVEQAKKLFNVTDKDIQRALSGGTQPGMAPSTSPPPQPQEQSGGLMQKLAGAAPAVGQIVGSVAGNVAGPVGRMAGGTIGAGVGEQVNQMAQGKEGDPLAAGSFVPPLALLNALPHALDQLKGKQTKLSSVEKTQQNALKSQATGEALGFAFSLLKPGATSKLFNDITNFLAKKGKGGVDRNVITNRFLNETLPKALKSSGEISPEVIKKEGQKLIYEANARYFDPEELNYVRQQFNSIGKGQMHGDLTKFLANDLGRILREEESKLVPATGMSIGAESLTHQVPNILRQLPFGRFFLGTGQAGNQGVLGLGGKLLSKLGGNVSKFLLPGMIQGGSQEQE